MEGREKRNVAEGKEMKNAAAGRGKKTKVRDENGGTEGNGRRTGRKNHRAGLRQRNLWLTALPFGLMLAMLLLIVRFQLVNPLSQMRFGSQKYGIVLQPEFNEEYRVYHLYLPSFLPPEELEVELPWYLYMESFPRKAEEEVELRVKSFFSGVSHYKFFLRQNTVPGAIFLDVEPETLNYLNEDKERKRPVTASVYERGELCYRGSATMYGRGNASFTDFPKKPYNLEFPQEITMGPLENLGKLSLLSNSEDRMKIRTALMFQVGQELGIPFTSPYEFADLYVNGEYMGLYGVATKEEYKKDESLLGVYEFSSSIKGEQKKSQAGSQIRIYQGDGETVMAAVNALESAIQESRWEDVAELADMDLLAKKYAMDELFYDIDLNWASQYFFLRQDGKIVPMLPWDYDHILEGRFYPYVRNPRESLGAFFRSRVWFQKLLEWEGFREKVKAVLREEFPEEALGELQGKLLEWNEEIDGSRKNDYYRWFCWDQDREKVTEEIEGIMAFVRDRKEFLLDYLTAPENYCTIYFYEVKGLNRIFYTKVLPKDTYLGFYEYQLKMTNYDGLIGLDFYDMEGKPFSFRCELSEDLHLVLAGKEDEPLLLEEIAKHAE